MPEGAGAHEDRLAYLDHLLVDNRQGLIVDATTADGTAEADAALLAARGRPRLYTMPASSLRRESTTHTPSTQFRRG